MKKILVLIIVALLPFFSFSQKYMLCNQHGDCVVLDSADNDKFKTAACGDRIPFYYIYEWSAQAGYYEKTQTGWERYDYVVRRGRLYVEPFYPRRDDK